MLVCLFACLLVCVLCRRPGGVLTNNSVSPQPIWPPPSVPTRHSRPSISTSTTTAGARSLASALGWSRDTPPCVSNLHPKNTISRSRSLPSGNGVKHAYVCKRERERERAREQERESKRERERGPDKTTRLFERSPHCRKPTLRSLHMGGNWLNRAGEVAMQAGLEHNRTLVELSGVPARRR